MNPKLFTDLTENCCSPSLDRRSFLKTAALPFGVTALGGVPSVQVIGERDALPASDSESLVTSLYKSLEEPQRAKICLPFDHKKRSQVENNWHITKARVGGDFTPDQ